MSVTINPPPPPPRGDNYDVGPPSTSGDTYVELDPGNPEYAEQSAQLKALFAQWDTESDFAPPEKSAQNTEDLAAGLESFALMAKSEMPDLLDLGRVAQEMAQLLRQFAMISRTANLQKEQAEARAAAKKLYDAASKRFQGAMANAGMTIGLGVVQGYVAFRGAANTKKSAEKAVSSTNLGTESASKKYNADQGRALTVAEKDANITDSEGRVTGAELRVHNARVDLANAHDTPALRHRIPEREIALKEAENNLAAENTLLTNRREIRNINSDVLMSESNQAQTQSALAHQESKRLEGIASRDQGVSYAMNGMGGSFGAIAKESHDWDAAADTQKSAEHNVSEKAASAAADANQSGAQQMLQIINDIRSTLKELAQGNREVQMSIRMSS